MCSGLKTHFFLVRLEDYKKTKIRKVRISGIFKIQHFAMHVLPLYFNSRHPESKQLEISTYFNSRYLSRGGLVYRASIQFYCYLKNNIDGEIIHYINEAVMCPG